MNWGKWIVVAFVLFAAFIATLVTVCMRQEINLVSKDYYKDELAYQEQITRIKNATMLEEKPTIKTAGDWLNIDYAEADKIESGALKLFRPSDAKMDKAFQLKPNGTKLQSFPIDDLAKGMYRARMQWKMNGDEYYLETVIHI